MVNEPEPDDQCPDCGEPIDLGDQGVLTVRHASPGDEDALDELYSTLQIDDLNARFFTGAKPGAHFLQRWVILQSNNGMCLLVDLERGGERTTIAEAGFAPLADGDAELGITVARGHRGWIGPWLLDVLLTHAARAGIANLQALVKTTNRPMLGIIKHRGCARFDSSEWGTTRVTMSTTGHTPSWPPHSARPRVLIESPRARPSAAKQLRDQHGTTLICGGFDKRGSHCPLHDGQPCPLITGADAVVIDSKPFGEVVSDRSELGPGDLATTLAQVHPDANVIIVEDNWGGSPPADASVDLGLPKSNDTDKK